MLLASDAEHIALRHDLSLRLGRDLLHEVDDAHEHGLALLECFLLLVGADKDKLGILLAGTTFHLDQSPHGLNLIQADHLVASGDIQALLHHISRNQHVDLTLPELVKCLFELILRQFDGSDGGQLAEHVFVEGHLLGVERLVGAVDYVLRLETHRKADAELSLVQNARQKVCVNGAMGCGWIFIGVAELA